MSGNQTCGAGRKKKDIAPIQPPKTLEECAIGNTPRWNFDGLTTLCKIVSIYDGDTVTVAFNTFNLGFFLHNIRLEGIDTPEIKGGCAVEKEAATKARDFLREFALGRMAMLNVKSADKYGRLLSRITLLDGNIDISNKMIESGFARPYDGGTKAEWSASDLSKNPSK